MVFRCNRIELKRIFVQEKSLRSIKFLINIENIGKLCYISIKKNCATRWHWLNLTKNGGGVYEYIRSFDIINSFRNISYCTVYLHR